MIKKNIAKEIYSASSSSLDDLISIASHEIKTPISCLKLQIEFLTKLISNNQIIIQGPKATGVHQFINDAEEQIRRLNKMVDTLLDSSKKYFELKKEYINPHQIILNVLDQIKFKDYPIYFKPELDILGFWDKFKFEQIITNLVSNAVKYGNGKPIYITTHSTKLKFHIIVQDHGIGIPKKYHSEIFDKYARVVHNHEGHGLGLYITHEIVKLHGGQISVLSEEGKGSTFIVELPLILNE
ncbi:MAG: sensor histidine kinase [Bacteriovoracaceae bacterium]